MSEWYKPRKPQDDYPKTSHQKKIGTAGKTVAKICKGKKKVEFRACRQEVMQCVFRDQQCTKEILDAKEEVEKR